MESDPRAALFNAVNSAVIKYDSESLGVPIKRMKNTEMDYNYDDHSMTFKVNMKEGIV